jgi:hypothetical protein
MKAITTLLLIFAALLNNGLFACTLFSVNQGESLAYVGYNGDDQSEDHAYEYYYIEPGKDGKYGAIYFGSDKDKQSAINERGLFYANAAIPSWPLEKYPQDNALYEEGFKRKLMQECATVEEAVQLLKTCKTKLFAFVHTLIADRTGKSVLVEWNGEELQIIKKKGSFQVATNFLISQIEDENRISCTRYRNARDRLTTHKASLGTCRAVLAATHLDHTRYSLIGDLQSGSIYFFTEHDYEKVAVINVSEELQKGPVAVKISNVLFMDVFA